jgi:hypothetical protein
MLPVDWSISRPRWLLGVHIRRVLDNSLRPLQPGMASAKLGGSGKSLQGTAFTDRRKAHKIVILSEAKNLSLFVFAHT